MLALALAVAFVEPAPGAAAGSPPDPAARADLVIPDDLWAMIDAGLGLGGGPLGYSPEEMAAFGRDRHLLRPVLRAFRDVRETLRTSGRATDHLLRNADVEDELLRHAFSEFLGESVGRRIPLPGLDAAGTSGELPAQFDPARETGRWGVAWLERDGEDLDLDAAFVAAVARVGGDAAGALDAWRPLPDAVRRLVVRLLVAVADAGPFVENAFDHDLLARALRAAARGQGTEHAYAAAVATAAWRGPEPSDRVFFDLVGATDLSQLGHAAVLVAKHVRLALAEFERAGGRDVLTAPGLAALKIEIPTPGGPVVLAGTGADRHANAHVVAPVLLVDLGGDDTYVGAFAVGNVTAGRPVSLVIDLGGNDRYGYDDDVLPTWSLGGEGPGGAEPRRLPTLAAGVFGLGMLWDLGGGDDVYVAHESSLGAAWHGVGLLVDGGGDDVYTLATSWGQGAGFVGLGALIDRGGDDTYTAAQRAQGLGQTRGAGVLVDVAGNDRYTIRDDGAPSALYLGRTVAMGQGCGYGRRADLGDGRSLAGGFGVLVDGAGDDVYHAMAWAQGCAYWWGVGILEDRGGNDTYRNGKYSMGAGAHFGVGVFVDLAGDDRYNAARERMTNPFTGDEQWVAENQYAGHARDGAVGIFVDGGGDDVHVLRANCGGSADLNSVGFFWSRAGDDAYLGLDVAESPSNPDWERPPIGTATHYPAPFRDFRDDMPSRGVFLDSGGRDRYEGVGGRASDDATWTSRPGPRTWGLGIDVDRFPTPRPDSRR